MQAGGIVCPFVCAKSATQSRHTGCEIIYANITQLSW